MDIPGGVVELDSDMADITQGFPSESMLGGDEDRDLVGDMDGLGGKLGGLSSAEHDGISASSHIASSLGINPHTLQVHPVPSQSESPPVHSSARIKLSNLVLSTDHEGVFVC